MECVPSRAPSDWHSPHMPQLLRSCRRLPFWLLAAGWLWVAAARIAAATPSGSALTVGSDGRDGDFALVSTDGAAALDFYDGDFPVVRIAAEALADDLLKDHS